jgi:hypothetical protein
MDAQFVAHPSFGLLPMDRLESPLPLVQSQLAVSWVALTDDIQEESCCRWREELARWLTAHHANCVEVDVLEGSDRVRLGDVPGLASLGRGCYSGPWTGIVARELGELVSPQEWRSVTPRACCCVWLVPGMG